MTTLNTAGGSLQNIISGSRLGTAEPDLAITNNGLASDQLMFPAQAAASLLYIPKVVPEIFQTEEFHLKFPLMKEPVFARYLPVLNYFV